MQSQALSPPLCLSIYLRLSISAAMIITLEGTEAQWSCPWRHSCPATSARGVLTLSSSLCLPISSKLAVAASTPPISKFSSCGLTLKRACKRREDGKRLEKLGDGGYPKVRICRDLKATMRPRGRGLWNTY
ncbi:hypothetical protein CDL15_Pgr011747 [Punica granatum]|uniref:Uncharacterized protein n=1 Tax=Punica granatum TaxID=22663 RepID=A0A218XCY6_PUNGR|nr:hypothetical protein CDL15_Pgr011747 [Punica granatum]